MALEQLIPRQPCRHWHDEWVDLSVQKYALEGVSGRDEAWVLENETVEQATVMAKADIEYDMAQGWPEQDAVTLNLLQQRRAPMVEALSRHESKFAASIHALADAFLRQASRATEHGLMPPTYRNLRGADSLVANDPAWVNIELTDRNGFCGVCAMGVTKGTRQPNRFDEGGLKAYVQTSTGTWEPSVQDSAVVCFESEEGIEGDETIHNAIRIHDEAAAYIPNTLFRLVRVDDSFTAPNGKVVKQRVLTVRSFYCRAGCLQL